MRDILEIESPEEDLVANVRTKLRELSLNLQPEQQEILQQIIQYDIEKLDIRYKHLLYVAEEDTKFKTFAAASEKFSGLLHCMRVKNPEAADYVLQQFSRTKTKNAFRDMVRKSKQARLSTGSWAISKHFTPSQRGSGKFSKTVADITKSLHRRTCSKQSPETTVSFLFGENVSDIKNIKNIKKILRVYERPKILDDTAFEFGSQWEFDILQFADKPEVGGMPLLVLGHFLIIESGLQRLLRLDMARVDSWLRAVEESYREVPYHNHLHGADVMCSMYHWFISKLFKANMSLLDMLTSVMAAAAHDVGHDAVNNNFHISVWSELAQRYNNISPLENFHAAQASQLLSESDKNWLESFSVEDRCYVRSLMLKLILATDFQCHQAHQRTIQEALNRAGNTVNVLFLNKSFDKPGFKSEKEMFLEAGLHLADVSNPAKPIEIAVYWAECIMQEFFEQGAKEKKLGIPISPLCDQENSNVAQGQVGFIKFVVLPLYDLWAKLMPEFNGAVTYLKQNLAFWENKETDGSTMYTD